MVFTSALRRRLAGDVDVHEHDESHATVFTMGTHVSMIDVRLDASAGERSAVMSERNSGTAACSALPCSLQAAMRVASLPGSSHV